MKRKTGKYVSITVSEEKVNAFVPHPLPPKPALILSEKLTEKLNTAEQKLAELRVAAELVPNVDLFAYSFVRKESIFSSQIEGIQATLSDLLEFEASPEMSAENQDIVEVCNYLDALLYAKGQIADPKGLPISLRLIRETHKRLMKKGRGSVKAPGEFRRTQNWIGGERPGKAHFVPPPPDMVEECLGNLERFIHDERSNVDPLIKIGLLHVQFETIHPFLDGNGRLGRLLITLLLESWKGLDARLLYLSLYFKKHQQEYYQRLDSVRSEGDWEGWTAFFLQGIAETSEEAKATAQQMFRLFEKDRQRIISHAKVVIPAIRLFELLPSHPVVTIPMIVKQLKTTKPTAGKAVDFLVKLGVLQETSHTKRNRIFGYEGYLKILKGIEN
ncbi:MAG: Fic family protein [Oligoflexales bacterium]